MAKALYHRLAAQEARAAEFRYRKVNAEVAERFRLAVDSARRRIEASPETLAVLVEDYRQVRCSGFHTS